MLRFLAPFALLLSVASAQDLVVRSGGSIQAAIQQASAGARVVVLAGTYNERIDFLGKAITVVAIDGPSRTTIDGGGGGAVVRFVNGEGPGSRLAGFTIRGGSASAGAGGIAAATGATPTVEDCVIRNNVGRFGGGVSGSPNLRRCSILSNTASQSHGGGIYGAPTMRYCVVAGNRCSGARGGGLYVSGGIARVEDCVFVENAAILANSDAGAIGMSASGDAVIRGCVFLGNYATGGVFPAIGGAIQGNAGTTIDGCTILGNLLSGSSVQGGAVYGPVTVTNSIVRGNSLPQFAGGAAARYSDVEGGAAGPGNFDAVPGFVDEPNRDFHLTATSPCVDTGDPRLTDPDGTRRDVGAFAFASLYVRSNARSSDWTSPSWPELSAVVGGQIVLRTLSEGTPGGIYLMLGTTSGATPGIVLGGQTVPLNPDFYTAFCLGSPNSALLGNSLGTLDARGRAETVFVLPSIPTGLPAPLILHHATLVAGTPGSLQFVTNAVESTVVAH